MSIVVVGVIVTLAALSLALSLSAVGTYNERRASVASTRVRYVAEGIVDEGLARLRANGLEALRTQTGFPRTVSDVSQTLAVTYGDTSATVADDLVRLVGVANHDGVRYSVESYIRWTRTVDPFLLAFGDRTVTLDGNSTIDAYDSSLGSWSSQATNSSEGIPYAMATSSVGSNGSITMDSNAQILGDARSGPGYSVSESSNADVSGSSGAATGSVTLPPVVVPVITSSGPRTIASSATMTIPAGIYHWPKLTVGADARVTIRGPSTLVIDDWLADSNARITFDTSTGPIQVYATGPISFLSNVVVGPKSGLPKDLRIQASGVDKRILLDSNAVFTGQIYAPASTVELLSNAHVWGSVVGRHLDFDSNAFISVDLDLLKSAAMGGYIFTKVSWRSGTNLQ